MSIPFPIIISAQEDCSVCLVLFIVPFSLPVETLQLTLPSGYAYPLLTRVISNFTCRRGLDCYCKNVFNRGTWSSHVDLFVNIVDMLVFTTSCVPCVSMFLLSFVNKYMQFVYVFEYLWFLRVTIWLSHWERSTLWGSTTTYAVSCLVLFRTLLINSSCKSIKLRLSRVM